MNATTTMRRLACVAAVLSLTIGCGDDDEPAANDEPATDEAAPEGPALVLRGQDFSESETIAQVYGQYLEARGYEVEVLTAAGFRTEAFASLDNGDVNLIVDYIGGVQTELAPDSETSSETEEVTAAIEPLLEDRGATLLEPSPAVDGDAFVVRGDTDATTISDVAELDLVLGAAAQCFERPQCFIGYTDPEVYGITFADTTTIEFGPLLGEALAAEEVDAVVWNTTAPQIEAEGFKVLEDDLGLHPAQNIAPIVDTEILGAYGDTLRQDLDELSAAISTDDLVAWNTSTDLDREEPDAVAADWLEAEGLD